VSAIQLTAIGLGGADCGILSLIATQFAGLLWRDLMVSLLLGVAERPNPREIAGRARAAAFLQLHPLPKHAPAC
jgi:hypothetical protein